MFFCICEYYATIAGFIIRVTVILLFDSRSLGTNVIPYLLLEDFFPLPP